MTGYNRDEVRKDLLKVARLLKHKGARPDRIDTEALAIHFTDQARRARGWLTPREHAPGLWWWWDVHLYLPDGGLLLGPIGPGRYTPYNPYPAWVVRAYLWEVRPPSLPRKGNVR